MRDTQSTIGVRRALKGVLSWAIAILAVALFISLLLGLVPFWVFHALLIGSGFVSAGIAIWTALMQSHSEARFHRLCHYLSASAIGIVFGAIGLFGQVDLGMESRARSRASMVMYLCVPVCLAVYFAWYQHASKNYGVRKSHPDFGEDDEGNPLRAE